MSIDRICDYFSPYRIYKNDIVYKDYLNIKGFLLRKR